MKTITTHGELLATYITFCNYKSIIEVGVQHGHTTRELCKAAKITGGYVYGYDYFEPIGIYDDNLVSPRNKVKDTLNWAGYGEDVCKLIKVNTQTDEFVKELKKHFDPVDCEHNEWDKTIDFAFIDACHSYKGVKNDFRKVYPFLSPTGTIAFHDSYSHPGVRKFVLELYNELNDGTFDVINLPFGEDNDDPDRKYGITFLVKRGFMTIPNKGLYLNKEGRLGSGVRHDDTTIEEVYNAEQEWYKTQIKQ